MATIDSSSAPVPAAAPRAAPGPRGHALLGSLGDFRADPLQLLLESAREFGDVVRFRFGPMTVHLLRHPDHVKQVLQDNNQNYGRHTRGFKIFKQTIGDSLLTTDGEFWRRQRRIAQPAFHRQRLAGFAGVMADAAVELSERLRPRAARGEPFDLTAELLRATLRILGLTLFSLDLSGEAESIGQALTTVLHHSTEGSRSIIHLPPYIPTPGNRRFRQALQTLDRVVFQMIDERRRSGASKPDLLSMLLEARDDETGEGMNDQQLRDEMVGLVLAGHETTAMALSWTFYLLSKFPAARRRLEAELAPLLGGRPPTLEELPRLPWTRAILDEAMRLFPPAWFVPRSVTGEDTIGGYRIPAGSIVMVSPYVTHRSPSLWENPEGFDPERFLDGGAPGGDARPRYAYFPFGGGPHQCIGAGFAMMEAQIVLATVAQRLRFDLVPGHVIEPDPLITLRPRNGVAVVARAL